MVMKFRKLSGFSHCCNISYSAWKESMIIAETGKYNFSHVAHCVVFERDSVATLYMLSYWIQSDLLLYIGLFSNKKSFNPHFCNLESLNYLMYYIDFYFWRGET